MIDANNKKIKNDGIIDLGCIDATIEDEANLQLPNPQLLQYYYDKRDRVIWIDKDIDETLFDEIKLIIQWNREDAKNNIPKEERKPIRLMIHSYGGNLDSCFAMVDLINISETPIYTYNINACMSAGALIYINGHKRYGMKMSTVLLHQGSGGAGGQYEQVVAQTENYKKIISMIKENILTHTTIPKTTLNKKFNTEWYIYIDDQLKYGITDEVIENMNYIIE